MGLLLIRIWKKSYRHYHRYRFTNITHQIGDFISLSQEWLNQKKHKNRYPKYPTEDEIEDIFHVLNINQTAHKEEDTENKKKEPEKLNRTDLPSFLKALN